VEGSLPWAVFVLSAVAVGFSGWHLARQGDRISSQTGLGGLWVGVILIASATSLPEIITNISAVAIDEPNLAAGNLFGSSMANMLILAVIDLMHRRRRVLQTISQGQGLVAMLAVALTVMAAAFIVSDSPLAIGHVGIETLVLGAVYLLGTRIVLSQEYVDALARIARTSRDDADNTRPGERPRVRMPERETALLFLAAAAVIVVAGLLLALSAEGISSQTGLDKSFVGVLFLATATSLPELFSSISAVRLGARDLAVGNLFGSNCFNMAAFVVVDFAYTPGPILDAVDQAAVVAALVAVFLMATAMMGIMYRAERRYWLLEPDAAAIIVAYGLGLLMVYDATI
jgi:cation:H+ antiporter